ncbi:hypothetical protein D3C71_2245590 [compost metagenome]
MPITKVDTPAIRPARDKVVCMGQWLPGLAAGVSISIARSDFTADNRRRCASPEAVLS